jgi:hypothetical protein
MAGQKKRRGQAPRQSSRLHKRSGDDRGIGKAGAAIVGMEKGIANKRVVERRVS